MSWPQWWSRMRKRILEPARWFRSPDPVLIHVGRASGLSCETKLDPVPISEGYAFVLPYTCMSEPTGEWVRNVLAAGSARLRLGEEVFSLVNPRLEAFGAARARMAVVDTDALPDPEFGQMLLVMDHEHRCVSDCHSRRAHRCSRCASSCPAVPGTHRGYCR